ncbi:transmembrane cell adhesion receptor mua-3 [Aphelenchoides avenae]|nr:transmembrane cell adhesion receptor mua-3 [Aphelenchus avenae]
MCRCDVSRLLLGLVLLLDAQNCNSHMLELELNADAVNSRPGNKTNAVVSRIVPLWIQRHGDREATYNEILGGLLADATQKHRFTSPFGTFERGVWQSYQETKLKNAFITAQVNSVVDPATIDSTWTTGIIFNSTMYYMKDALQSAGVHTQADAYRELVRAIVRNKCQLGLTELYISPSPKSTCNFEM